MFICKQWALGCTQPWGTVPPWGRTLERGPLGTPDLILILGDEQPNRVMTVTLMVMIALLMDMSIHERQAPMITYPFYR